MGTSVGVSLIGNVAGRWKELSGHDNGWSSLMDPLDMALRRCLLLYGDGPNAIYKSLNNKTKCNNRGFSPYPPEDFFTKQGIHARNPYKYRLTKFCYASVKVDIIPQLKGSSTWIAYVAVATDEGKALLGRRDILVAWRGTGSNKEWMDDFEAYQVSASAILGQVNGQNPMVHCGFHSLYAENLSDCPYGKISARDQVLSEVKNLVEQYKEEEVSITVTGHSLGASLATLNAVDIAKNGANGSFPVTGIVYGCPRVGNSVFNEVYQGLSGSLKILRIRNEPDKIPDLPLDIPPLFQYADVGEELKLDSRKSPYLDWTEQEFTIFDPHNIDVYLHTISLEEKSNGKYDLAIDYDIALVNRGIDGLKKKYGVPAKWWVQEKMGLVLCDDGHYREDTGYYVPDPPTT